MAEAPKTKTSTKLTEEIAYLGEWSEHMLEEMKKYRENLIFYTQKKADHGLTVSKLATMNHVIALLTASEESYTTVVKELRKLRGRNVRCPKSK